MRSHATWCCRLARQFAVVALGALSGTTLLSAQEESVVGTVHNLSVSGPGEVKSLSETQVCVFCHVPHNALVPEALWGHALTKAQFATPTLQRGRPGEQAAPPPDGSSLLCLSCHDGTVALGQLAGRPRPIAMAGRDRLRPGDRGFLGTDLTGSHPVSFVVEERSPLDENDDGDVGIRPPAAIAADPDVRLDSEGKMQCTTCHDPHSDRHFVAGKVPHFWVKSSLHEVCITCHVVR